MSWLELIDLNFGASPQAIGVYLVETDDGPALFDCGPASTLDALEAGLDEVLADERTRMIKQGLTAARPSYLPPAA
jgi:hypothetical protein